MSHPNPHPDLPDMEELADALARARPILLSLDAATALLLTRMLQLALRHPQFGAEANAKNALGFIESLTNGVCEQVPQARTLIDAGFNPAYDVPLGDASC